MSDRTKVVLGLAVSVISAVLMMTQVVSMEIGLVIGMVGVLTAAAANPSKAASAREGTHSDR